MWGTGKCVALLLLVVSDFPTPTHEVISPPRAVYMCSFILPTDYQSLTLPCPLQFEGLTTSFRIHKEFKHLQVSRNASLFTSSLMSPVFSPFKEKKRMPLPLSLFSHSY